MPIPDALLQRPNTQVLLLCACGPEKHEGFASVLSEVLDWETLMAELGRHRLTLLFAHHASGHEPLVPSAIRARLEDRCEALLHSNLVLLTELQRVMVFLGERNIRVLAYKGPSLSIGVYNSLALRSFGDLDLLISPRDRPKLVAALKTCGYRQVLTELAPFAEQFKERYSYEMQLMSQDGCTALDVHWNVAPQYESFPLGFEQMWQHRVALRSVGSTLCREDLLLALAFHGLKHGWELLEWIGCLLTLLLSGRDEPFDWERIETLFRAHDCGRILGLALRLAMDLSQAAGQPSPLREVIPSSLWSEVEADKGIAKLSAQIWNSVLGTAPPPSSAPASILKELTLGLRGRRRLVARSKFLFGSIGSLLVELERSKIALKLASPLLRLLPTTHRTRSQGR